MGIAKLRRKAQNCYLIIELFLFHKEAGAGGWLQLRRPSISSQVPHQLETDGLVTGEVAEGQGGRDLQRRVVAELEPLYNEEIPATKELT